MDPSSSGQGPFPASSSAASSSPTTLNAIHINMNGGQVLRSMATQRATQSSSGSILPQMYEDEWLDRQINSNKSDSTHHMPIHFPHAVAPSPHATHARLEPIKIAAEILPQPAAAEPLSRKRSSSPTSNGSDDVEILQTIPKNGPGYNRDPSIDPPAPKRQKIGDHVSPPRHPGGINAYPASLLLKSIERKMAQAKQSHAPEIEILDSDEEPSKPVPRGSISGILASANQQTNLRDKLCSLIPSRMRPNITPTKVEKPVVIQTDAQSGLEKMYANAQEFLASLHPAPQPKYMHTDLLDHQKIGLAWLLHQESQMRRGAILADDMGLGKTIMTLALIAATHDNPHKDGNRTLIVCPVSTVEHWRAEIDRHLIKENFRVAVFHGSSKKTENMEAMDILITTYGTVNALSKHEHNFFSGHSWARIILDEAHVIKNRKTQTAKNIGKLRAHRLRLAITGTPIQNTLDDLYSLLTFLRHPEYQDTKKWKAEIAAPVANSDPVGINRLQTLLGSVMLRRRKDMMINGQPIISLPRVITEEVTLSFTNQEQRFYDFAESELLAWVKKANFEAKIIQTDLWNILEKLLRVRQACNHPYLLLMGLAPFRYKVGSLYKTALLRTDFERVIAAAASNSAQPQSISDIISGGSPPTIKHPRCRHCEIDAVVPHVSGCGHEFCRDCITELIGTVSSCPVCGRALKTSKPMILDTNSEPTLQTAPSQDLESGVDGGDDDDSDDGSDSDDSDDSEDELGNQDSKSSPNNAVDVVSPSQDDDAMNVDPTPPPPPAANQPPQGAPRTFGALTAASMRSVSAMKPKAPPRFTPKIPPGRALAPRPVTAAPASNPPSSFGSPLASKGSKQESIMDVSDSSSDSFDAFSRSTTALDFLPDSMPELALYAKGIFKPMIPGEPPLRSIMRPEDLPPPPPVKETEEETKPGAKSKKNQKKKQPKPPEKDAVIDDFDRSEALLSSTKIDALLSRVVKMRADDPTGKAVIYSQFVGFLDLIQAKMTSAGLRVCRLDGKMSLEQRQRSIDELKDSNSCVAILVSLKAGGVGINLTAANHVFLMDPWWNPMIEQQAIDRVHRIGQEKIVYVHRLLVQNTVESVISQMQQRKKALADDILSEGQHKTKMDNSTGRFSARDVAALFQAYYDKKTLPT